MVLAQAAPSHCVGVKVRAILPFCRLTLKKSYSVMYLYDLFVSPGNRLIFLNVPLLDFEQKALDKLHEALKGEKALAPGGVMPSYVRLHALRLLQQAKWKVDKAISTIATHLETLRTHFKKTSRRWMKSHIKTTQY